MARTGRWRGLLGEVHVLLPVALLVLLVLLAFTLVSYRSGITLLVQERQLEAARLARTIVLGISDTPHDAHRLQLVLQRSAAQGSGVAVLDERGTAVSEAGALGEDVRLPALDTIDRATGLGPSAATGDLVIGLAPFAVDGRRYVLRLDLPASLLARQMRNLPLLTAVVLGVSGILFVTVLFYLRQLMAPYETLLARARTMAEPGQESGDEVTFLLQTFDRALDTLSRQETEGGDDIAVIERTLAPSLESGLLLLDREGAVLALNAIGAELLGVREPVAGQPLAEALAAQPTFAEVLRGAVRGERIPKRQECRVKVGDRTATLGLSVHPLRREDGEVRGWLVLFADLTKAEQRAREQRLAESLARLGEITAGVAHEMRNSLASLRGHLTLLERELQEDGPESVADVRHEADHLKRVLDDFLSFARPGSARMELLELEPLVRRALADPAIGEDRAVVEPPGAPLPRIQGDPQLLERALRNLMHNAVEAQQGAAAGTPVKVRFEIDPDELRILVEDRGAGIPEELREKLFVPFATGRENGVGLGLALTHRIVDLHGGKVELVNRPGGGTRAVLSFPSDRFATEGNRREPPVSQTLPA